MKRIFKPIKSIIVLTFWILVWFLVSLLINNRFLFPTPIDVFKRLFELIITGDFWISMLTSMGRVILGIIVAIILGVMSSIASYKVRIIYDILYPFMTILKSTPVASFIILIVLFIGKETVPTLITILMVLPVVWLNVYEGLLNVDSDLKEACIVFKINRFKRFKILYFPSVFPYFISSVLSSIGLGWKAGIASEILYPPLKSIGKSIFDAQQYLLREDLFAWTLVVILLSLLFESVVKLVVKLSSVKQSAHGKGVDNED